MRLTVDVPSADIAHAVEHASSDLAERTKVPGFRKGKVPMPVLIKRLGSDRVYAEAVESHVGGWLRRATAPGSGLHGPAPGLFPHAAQPH